MLNENITNYLIRMDRVMIQKMSKNIQDLRNQNEYLRVDFQQELDCYRKVLMKSCLLKDDGLDKCLKSIIYVSVVILFFQGISNTIMAIMGQFTYQNGEGWVGPLGNALLFLGSGLATHYNKYIDRLQYKYSFFIGSLGYTLFIGLTVIFLKTGFTIWVEVVILIGSLISGITVSMFYNSQFNYVNACSQIDGQKTKYFGINMCIVQSCNILSNLISALLIQPVGQFTYALIMNVLAFATSLFFLFVKNYNYNDHQISQTQNNQYQNNSLENLHQIIKVNTSQDLGIPQTILNKKSKYNIPTRIIASFCFSGVIISFIYGQLSIVFYDTFQKFYGKEDLNRITFIAFIIQGIGEFLGGLCVVFGQDMITKKLGVPITYAGITLIFLIGEVLIYFGSQMQSLVVINMSCLMVGFCNCMSFTLGLSISGEWKQRGISYFSSAQSVTVAVSLIIIAFVKFDYVIIYAGVMFAISTFGVLTYEKNIQQNTQ